MSTRSTRLASSAGLGSFTGNSISDVSSGDANVVSDEVNVSSIAWPFTVPTKRKA